MSTFGIVILCFFVLIAIVLFIAAKGDSYLKNLLLCSVIYVFAFLLIAINGWFLKLANPYTLGFLFPLLCLISIIFFLFIFFTKNKLVIKKNAIIHFCIFIIFVISLFITYLFIGTRYGLIEAISITFDIPILSSNIIENYFIVDNINNVYNEFDNDRLYSLYFFIGMCVQAHSILSFSFFMVYFIRKKVAIGSLLFLTWIFSLEIIYLLALFDLMRP